MPKSYEKDREIRTPPRRPTYSRLSKKERRAQLLACALDAFAERGLERAVHADVARKAGVSIPTVFVYFPTRRELVAAVLDEVERFLLTIVDEAPRSTGPVPAVLFETIWRFALSVESHSASMQVWLDWSTGIRGETWSLYLAVQDRIISDLREVVQRGQREGSVDENLDPGDAARIIVGEGHHVALMMFAGVDRERVRHFLAHLIESALLLGRAQVL